MKKQIAILATIMAAGSLSAFAQGYLDFTTGAGSDYNGSGAELTQNNYDVAFLWAVSTATDPLGAGVPTTGATSVAAEFSNLQTMASGASIDGSVWTIGENANGDTEADALEGKLGTATYNSGNPWQVVGTAAGQDIEIVAVSWNNEGGTVTSLNTALNDAGSDGIGYSWSFTYLTGATSGSAVDTTFSSSGLPPFGIAPVPEPTTLALAGLGGLSMLFLRRRKA